MKLYAVALVYHRKECGMYSRTVEDALIVRAVPGADESEAFRRLYDELRESFDERRGWIVWTWRASPVDLPGTPPRLIDRRRTSEEERYKYE